MQRKPKVVVTNRMFPETREHLARHAMLDMNENFEPWSSREVRERCRDAEGILPFMTDSLDAEFFASCPKLKIVGAALKGYDNIDVEAATRHGVWVTIVPDLLTVPTAELAIGLMLTLGRHILAGDRLIRARGFAGWRPTLYGMGIDGATIGIVGFGKVGRAIAERLSPFGCEILACDLENEFPPQEIRAPVAVARFEDTLQNADYVILALPLTPRTRHIIDRTAIAQMKPGALLINPARGSLVDEAAVAEALESGRLAGYAADVFECEDWSQHDRPRAIDPRLTSSSAPTVLTPHIGSAVAHVRREIEFSAANSIIEVLSGGMPKGALNDPIARSFHA
jgi:phosphonate dehydrogenase